MTKKPFYERLSGILQKTTVEPYLFLVMFGFNVRLITLQSLLHDRSCRVSLNISANICDQLDTEDYEDEQTDAVKYGNNLYNALVMISTIPALGMATFIGPWSDRYSRKYPLVIATCGVLLDTTLQAIVTTIPSASPYWFLASAVFSGFSGGLIIILSITYSYMSDITDERSRQTRFAILEFFTIMATPIGSFIGGQVFAKWKYVPVMFLGPCSFFMALLWVRFYVVETKARRFDITKRQMAQEVFTLHNMKESYKTCSQPRPGNLRLQIWLLVAVSFSLKLINMGTLSIGFSYTRKVFKWGVTRFSYTTTLFSLLNGFATVSVVPILSKRLCVHEAAIGLIGILSLMAKLTIMSVATFEGLIFYAWFSGCLFACGGIAVRSRISKLVSRHELGKVYSLLATFEATTPVLGTIIMTQIYNVSVSFYPGLTFSLAAFLLMPSACIFAWMMHLPAMSFAQYQEQEERKSMKELKDVSSNVF